MHPVSVIYLTASEEKQPVNCKLMTLLPFFPIDFPCSLHIIS